MREPDTERAGLRRLARDVNARLGGWLRLKRQLAGLTMVETGAVIGVTYQQVGKYETGANKIPASTLVLLAAELQLDLAELVEACLAGETLPSPPPCAHPLDRRLVVELIALDPGQQQALSLLLTRLRREPRPLPPEAVAC